MAARTARYLEGLEDDDEQERFDIREDGMGRTTIGFEADAASPGEKPRTSLDWKKEKKARTKMWVPPIAKPASYRAPPTGKADLTRKGFLDGAGPDGASWSGATQRLHSQLPMGFWERRDLPQLRIQDLDKTGELRALSLEDLENRVFSKWGVSGATGAAKTAILDLPDGRRIEKAPRRLAISVGTPGTGRKALILDPGPKDRLGTQGDRDVLEYPTAAVPEPEPEPDRLRRKPWLLPQEVSVKSAPKVLPRRWVMNGADNRKRGPLNGWGRFPPEQRGQLGAKTSRGRLLGFGDTDDGGEDVEDDNLFAGMAGETLDDMDTDLLDAMGTSILDERARGLIETLPPPIQDQLMREMRATPGISNPSAWMTSAAFDAGAVIPNSEEGQEATKANKRKLNPKGWLIAKPKADSKAKAKKDAKGTLRLADDDSGEARSEELRAMGIEDYSLDMVPVPESDEDVQDMMRKGQSWVDRIGGGDQAKAVRSVVRKLNKLPWFMVEGKKSWTDPAGWGWQELGLDGPGMPEVEATLQDFGIEGPNNLQAKAIPAILSNKDVILTAMTGCGKTLAFLMPLVSKYVLPLKNRIMNKNQEDEFKQKVGFLQPFARKKVVNPKIWVGPPVIIVTPSRELAQQQWRILRDLLKPFENLKVSCLVGGSRVVQEDEDLKNNQPAIVIATPGRLVDHLTEGRLSLRSLKAMVFDEVDRLLYNSRRDHMDIIEEYFNRTNAQCIAVSASISASARVAKRMEWFVRDNMKSPIKTVGPKTGIEIPPRVLHLVNGAPDIEKKVMFLKRLHGSTPEPNGILVFVNNGERARKVAGALRFLGIAATHLSGNCTKESRSRSIKDMDRGRVDVLVTTDVATRGLDFRGLTHVVNFELPGDHIEYVHRAGRCGRHGHNGIVITLAAGGSKNHRLAGYAKTLGIDLMDANVDFNALGVLQSSLDEVRDKMWRRAEEKRQKANPPDGSAWAEVPSDAVEAEGEMADAEDEPMEATGRAEREAEDEDDDFLEEEKEAEDAEEDGDEEEEGEDDDEATKERKRARAKRRRDRQEKFKALAKERKVVKAELRKRHEEFLEGLSKGVSVEAQYFDGSWYKATIEEERTDGKFVVSWDNDEDYGDRTKTLSQLRFPGALEAKLEAFRSLDVLFMNDDNEKEEKKGKKQEAEEEVEREEEAMFKRWLVPKDSIVVNASKDATRAYMAKARATEAHATDREGNLGSPRVHGFLGFLEGAASLGGLSEQFKSSVATYCERFRKLPQAEQQEKVSIFLMKKVPQKTKVMLHYLVEDEDGAAIMLKALRHVQAKPKPDQKASSLVMRNALTMALAEA